MNSIETNLSQLFESWAKEPATLILPLAPSGSNRLYYRISGKTKTVIGTYGSEIKENRAFITFSRHFTQQGLPVPELYTVSEDEHYYIQEDFGSTTLYSYLLQRKGEDFPEHVLKLYEKIVGQLPRIQVIGGKGLNYDKCYPRKAFDEQSMLWDLNYFKYYFLKLAGVTFDEQELENDFHRLIRFLLGANTDHFVFRDFQSRNIMIKNGEPFFIDYQGGRQGAMQYDLASLLYQAKAQIPPATREHLVEKYLDAAMEVTTINRNSFKKYYYGYALIRVIQTLGAYGFRGLYERKHHFLSSIPLAINNLKSLLSSGIFEEINTPTLQQALIAITEAERFKAFDKNKGINSLLTVHVNSFSYKITGIPEDNSGNGGGFVFDCRFIHNPGRYEPYKRQTGRDEPVQTFLKQHSQMPDFLNSVFHIVDEAVRDYIERSFTSLSINFGCTGGQHRSVYAADQVAKHIKDKFGVKVVLHHIVQEAKNWEN